MAKFLAEVRYSARSGESRGSIHHFPLKSTERGAAIKEMTENNIGMHSYPIAVRTLYEQVTTVETPAVE